MQAEYEKQVARLRPAVPRHRTDERHASRPADSGASAEDQRRGLSMRARDAGLQRVALHCAGACRLRRVRALAARSDLLLFALRWNGIGPAESSGSTTTSRSSPNPSSLELIGNAFQLILYFSSIPVGLGLAVAAVIRGWHRAGSARHARRAPCCSCRRSFRSSPPASPGAGCSPRTASSTRCSRPSAWAGVTRGWLGDFDSALPAVGIIGAWVLLGLCTMLLVTGIAKIDPALYEAARLDGAGPGEFIYDHPAGPAPGDRRLHHRDGDRRAGELRHRLHRDPGRPGQHHHRAGPRRSTGSPSAHRQVGLASALAIVLMILVLVCILPIQWLMRERMSRERRPPERRCSAAALLVVLMAVTLLPFLSMFSAALPLGHLSQLASSGRPIRNGATSSRRSKSPRWRELLMSSVLIVLGVVPVVGADRHDGRLWARQAARPRRPVRLLCSSSSA